MKVRNQNLEIDAGFVMGLFQDGDRNDVAKMPGNDARDVVQNAQPGFCMDEYSSFFACHRLIF